MCELLLVKKEVTLMLLGSNAEYHQPSGADSINVIESESLLVGKGSQLQKQSFYNEEIEEENR